MQELQSLPDWFANIESADGAFAVDRKHRIISWSASAQRLLGYDADEVLGKPCYEMVAGRDGRNLSFCRKNCPVLENAKRGRATPDYDVQVSAKDGEVTWLNMSILLCSSDHGNSDVALHIFRDVTSRRRLEKRAETAIAAMRQLLNEEDASGGVPQDPAPTPRPQLTKREQEVLRLLACALTTKEIAESMGVSAITARNHVTNLLAKMGARNRLQAVIYASQQNLS